MGLALSIGLVLLQAGTPGERLLAAAEAGNLTAVQAILDGLQRDVDLRVRTVVSEGGQHAVNQLLTSVLRKNAVLNGRKASWTPLMTAAERGHTGIVEALLKAGANPSLTNSDGLTAATLANQAGHTQLGSLLESSIK